MTATVRLFAAAAEAAGTESTEVDAATVGDLRALLADRHGEGLERVLRQCAVVVGGRRVDDDHVLDGQLVDVLPPFAGG
ncbi:MoaD/ThiS family protein [Demequina activiva]|uniref:Molybdenum cofactor biosynthesis protein D2 (MoaD2) / thiamineS n=1 Tax=Demequina activiva TaxID=1582364 RepID=A0A919Q3S5_9MICO|nr:MoaD/ThiS family protein [Demequina activiva]GIG55049.1 putative molybdenum cofactor biosynthesis protein D2 (MoaD2) / thiamineS [Demequina activiva]